jgi:protein-disulfide isomerase
VATIVGAVSLVSAANIVLAQDDWVRLPSSSSDSNSETAGQPSSQDSTATGDHPQRGGPNAPITIVEYSDFQCPYCRKEESTLKQVLNKYGDRVRVVYMDFPLAFHPDAMDAAMAARCADEQGQFWAYHDALFANPSGVSTPALKTAASQLGLDRMSFDRCLDSHKYRDAVVADRTQGEAAGADGTPYFVVNGVPMSGDQPVSAFESVIDQQLRNR